MSGRDHPVDPSAPDLVHITQVARTWSMPVRAALDALASELVALRRQLHMQPELSWQEHRTTELIAERLRIAGLDPQPLSIGTGLVCDIGNTTSGRFVVLRADIDALAMNELADVPYRSRIDGVAHACGHDAHSAIVLGAGLAIAQARDQIASGEWGVRLIFEPGEENVPGGAVRIVEDGWLNGATSVFGVHCDPRIDVGLIGLRRGAITSASDLLTIRLFGPGGHTARPQLTVDLVRVAADVVRELPDEVRRSAADLGAANVVFGALHTGDAANVIPSRAELSATFRTPDAVVWGDAEVLMRDALEKVLVGTGATYELDHVRGVPPVVNDEAEARLMAAVAEASEGEGAVIPTQQSLGGDSFAWYLQQVPGAYARLGVHNADGDRARVDLHSSEFDLDERAIPVGARLLAMTALTVVTTAPTH
jgi:amidohydrolase